MRAAGTRMAKAKPAKSNPRVNLAGLDGSARRRPSASQIHANTGASATTKIGCTNWNQPAGNSQPMMKRLVWRSAKRFRDDPACSNDAQKRADATKRTSTAAERFRSSSDQLFPKINHEKTSTEIAISAQPSASEMVVASIEMAPVAASTPTIANKARPAPTAAIALRF